MCEDHVRYTAHVVGYVRPAVGYDLSRCVKIKSVFYLIYRAKRAISYLGMTNKMFVVCEWHRDRRSDRMLGSIILEMIERNIYKILFLFTSAITRIALFCYRKTRIRVVEDAEPQITIILSSTL